MPCPPTGPRPTRRWMRGTRRRAPPHGARAPPWPRARPALSTPRARARSRAPRCRAPAVALQTPGPARGTRPRWRPACWRRSGGRAAWLVEWGGGAGAGSAARSAARSAAALPAAAPPRRGATTTPDGPGSEVIVLFRRSRVRRVAPPRALGRLVSSPPGRRSLMVCGGGRARGRGKARRWRARPGHRRAAAGPALWRDAHLALTRPGAAAARAPKSDRGDAAPRPFTPRRPASSRRPSRLAAMG